MIYPFVYIITNKKKGTLYTGSTTDIVQRIYQHKHGLIEGFSNKHDLNLLVYYEQHAVIDTAALKEKQMKEWKRKWKIDLVEANNPNWLDLYNTLL